MLLALARALFRLVGVELEAVLVELLEAVAEASRWVVVVEAVEEEGAVVEAEEEEEVVEVVVVVEVEGVRMLGRCGA